MCGIGSHAVCSGRAYLVPDEQPLSPATGNTIGQPCTDHEAHQWGIHDVFQRQMEEGRPSVQGRYQAILVEADAYAVEPSRYMHLNPVRAGMVAKPEQDPWSSSRSSMGQ